MQRRSTNHSYEYTEAGGNFIDTSDAYQNGESESIIGEFIGSKRDDYIISSKFTRSASPHPSVSIFGNNRKAMIQSVEQSLKRLKTDRIDIYIAHLDDNVTPTDELVRGFNDLVSAGKVIYGGLSNFPSWKTATAVNTANLQGKAPIIALQTEFSLVSWNPDDLKMLINFLQKHDTQSSKIYITITSNFSSIIFDYAYIRAEISESCLRQGKLTTTYIEIKKSKKSFYFIFHLKKLLLFPVV